MPDILGWIFFGEHVGEKSIDEIHFTSCVPKNMSYDFGLIQASDSNLKKKVFSVVNKIKRLSSSLFKLDIGYSYCQAASFFIVNQYDGAVVGIVTLFFEINSNKLVIIEDEEGRSFFERMILPSLSSKGNSKVKWKTLQAVKLMALGLSTDEISKEMNLTNRGVEYHLDIAKYELGATNRPSLVFFANQSGWF